MSKDPGKARKEVPAPDAAKVARGKPAGKAANTGLSAQNRRILGKHYAAKYGVRKGRG